jgi:hypothetical protein
MKNEGMGAHHARAEAEAAFFIAALDVKLDRDVKNSSRRARQTV